MAKKKTTTRKKTSPSSTRKTTSSARSKTSSKKKTTSPARKTTKKKSVSRSSTTKKKTTGKKTTKKSPARSAAKKSTTKKRVTKKAATSKKTARKTTKKTAKKTSAKKTTAKKTSKTVAKKAPAKKSVSKKTGSKKKTSAKKSSSKKTVAKKAPATTKKTTKKTTKTKTKKKKSGRRTGRSVAEVASSSERDSEGYVFINGRRVRMISVNTEKMAKRTKSRSTTKASDSVAIPATKKKIKKRFDRKQLKYYEALLLAKRNELLGDLGGMEAQALRSDSGENSHMPTHMADAGSDAYEQDFMLSLAENERARLVKIDEALSRIKDGSYGTCDMTGRAIPKARLEAKPWAKYTVEAAREVERRG